MRFNLYRDVKAFYRDTFGMLMRHETQNMIPLGNIIIGNEGKDREGWRDPSGWFMATVAGDSGIELTAVMTPPFNLTLYAADNKLNDAALDCLIGGITQENITIGGVTSAKPLAERFAELYAAAKGLKHRIDMSQRIYELAEVNRDVKYIGNLRLSKESDMAFLPYWLGGFVADCFNDPLAVVNADQARYHISTNRLYILEDNGTPVSMAKVSREMVNACGISLVYTPPYFRGKGYAVSCVSGVSQACFDRGFTFCVLYADLANPTSNGLYKKIGYKPICDSLEIKFE